MHQLRLNLVLVFMAPFFLVPLFIYGFLLYIWPNLAELSYLTSPPPPSDPMENTEIYLM